MTSSISSHEEADDEDEDVDAADEDEDEMSLVKFILIDISSC